MDKLHIMTQQPYDCRNLTTKGELTGMVRILKFGCQTLLRAINKEALNSFKEHKLRAHDREYEWEHEPHCELNISYSMPSDAQDRSMEAFTTSVKEDCESWRYQSLTNSESSRAILCLHSASYGLKKGLSRSD